MKIAQKTDWKIEPFPKEIEALNFERQFSSEEMEKIKKGLIPKQMEDKWFIYFENNSLNFHRSWTGHKIYELQFTSESNGSAKVKKTLINKNPAEFSIQDDKWHAEFLNTLIDLALLKKAVSFPFPKQIDDDKKALFKQSVMGN